MAALQSKISNLKSKIKNHVAEINAQLTKLYQYDPVDSKLVEDEMDQFASLLIPYISDISTILYAALREGSRVLAEGAQGTLLDLDHGTYPFVTSSTPTSGGALVGLGRAEPGDGRPPAGV